jgi:UDP-2,4-diacetamido-2,4,6-trideoxy-beta-L-altropyranose hydrolase
VELIDSGQLMALRGQVISFRADASLRLGTGHVMRCLTLAEELCRSGATCQFICRQEPGDQIRNLIARGYAAHALTAGSGNDATSREMRELRDGEETCEILSRFPSSLVVVDHYALGERWESMVCDGNRRLVAIDDLADRRHDCDLLVDQNLARSEDQYRDLVPSRCQILAGPTYASLRPEFSEWRDYSLRRRAQPSLQRLFVSMGGLDQANATGSMLAALPRNSLPSHCRITVVLGQGAPWVDQVRDLVVQLPWATDVLVSPDHIAEIMANCDLGIGAAGGTAWERCCLGLPSLIVVVAENQRLGADALDRTGAAVTLGDVDHLADRLPDALAKFRSPGCLIAMSSAASRLVDGMGAARVCRKIRDLLEIP